MLHLMKDDIAGLLEELSAFPGREEAMRKLMRWSIQPIMFYRSSLHSHGKRVAYHIAHIAPLLRSTFNGFDFRRALALALVHDDAEMVTGDIQAGNKAKMTDEQLARLEEEERAAIRALAERSPARIGGYSYRELLEDILDLSTIEARVAKFLDRADAFGEGLHELYAGNVQLTKHVVNEWGVIPRFYELYGKKLPEMLETFMGLSALKDSHPFFSEPVNYAWEEMVLTRAPHARESLATPTGHPQYDEWKRAVLSSGDEEEIENLIAKKEGL